MITRTKLRAIADDNITVSLTKDQANTVVGILTDKKYSQVEATNKTREAQSYYAYLGRIITKIKAELVK